MSARNRARSLRNAVVNQELRKLEAVRRSIRRNEVDVLVLGDSGCLTPWPGDTDLTMIPEWVGRRLGGARVAAIAGPGYRAALYDEMVRLLSGMDERPQAVVVAIAVRTHLARHVREHPIYSYRRTRAVLDRLEPGRRVPWFGKGERTTPEEYADFFGLPVHTRWAGDSTIGAFRRQLTGRGPRPWPEDLERVHFDYFHGEVLDDDHPGFAELEALGARLEEYGVPAFAYWTVPPIEYGERLYPGEFEAKVRDDWARARKALERRAPGITVLEPELDEPDFEDAQNATEHFREKGREKIAALVAGAIADRGAVRPARGGDA